MASLKDKIAKWGKRNLKTDDLQVTLSYLYSKRGYSQKKISNMFNHPAPAVRYWLRKYNLIKSNGGFVSRLNEMGYSDLSGFFTAPDNVRKTFKELAEEVACSYVTVSKWYNVFLDEMEDTK